MSGWCGWRSTKTPASPSPTRRCWCFIRSRPAVELRYLPRHLELGSNLEVQITLKSRGRTPVSVVRVRLRCLQQIGVGDGAQSQTLAAAIKEANPGYLEPGDNVFEHRFQLPDYTPPSYLGRGAWVMYELELHVVIPWWRDRRVTWLLPVHPQPTPLEAEAPKVFVIPRAENDPRVLIEATLGATTVPRGGAIAGRLSLSNLGDLSPRQLTVSLVAQETYDDTTLEIARIFAPEQPSPRSEGESVPFQLQVPINAPYSYQTSWSLEWAVQIRLKLNWHKDAVLHIPVRVVAAERAAATPTVALVGRERRSRLWISVARELGIEYDATREGLVQRLRLSEVHIGVEADPGSGYRLAARLHWKPLGLDLDVGSRRGGMAIGNSRYTARGHETAQVRALFDDAVCRALSADALHDVSFDDAGAHLSSSRAGDTAEELISFTNAVLNLAAAFDDSIGRLPARTAMKPYAEAWRRHAEGLHGRFEPGRIRIHDGVAGQDRVEIATLWSRDDEVGGTRVRLLLAPPLAEPPPAHSPEVVQLRSECENVILDTAALELHLQLAALDPAGLTPLVERAQRLVMALRGTGGPYR